MRRLSAIGLAACAVVAGCSAGKEDGDGAGSGPREPRTVEGGGWEIAVAAARTERSLAGSHDRTFASRSGETFVVVETVFRNASSGRELEIATRQAELVDERGEARRADGGGEEELCVDCTLTLSTGGGQVAFRFVFAVPEPVPRRLSFRYAGSAPLPLPLSGEGETFAGEPAGAWTKIVPGGRTTCARGTPYAFWFHDASPEKLLVFFQAGGGCFDVRSCAPGSALFDDSITDDDNPAVSDGGILDLDDPENPFRGYSVLFIPSCTGDVHWGDNVRTYTDGNRSVTVRHRGFVNARAALDWAAERVPSPKDVFVTGCSAGSVGSAALAPYLIERYEGARVTQLGDSLAFVFHRALDIQEDYRAHGNFPRWIPALRRMNPGTFTMAGYYAAIARHYRRSVFSQFNYSRDRVQQMFYEALGGDPDEFPGALARSLAEVRRAAPNFRCYTAEGDGHCVLNGRDFYTHETDGVRLRDWVAALAAGRPLADVGRKVATERAGRARRRAP